VKRSAHFQDEANYIRDSLTYLERTTSNFVQSTKGGRLKTKEILTNPRLIPPLHTAATL
jgi:hypothetical protein